jgi:MarR family transcriptional regulator, lower aerobic nicotinate degradation pathway regulator
MNPDLPTSEPPKSVDVLTSRVGYLFAQLKMRWAEEARSALGEAGLGLSGMHFGALSVIDAAGPISQQELGEYVRKDRTTIVALVDDLESEGLVERRRNPVDRRAYALELTDEGREWLAAAGPALAAAEDRLLVDLDDEERAKLLDTLQRVLFSAGPGG